MKNFCIAVESGWRAFKKQYRKRLTELRKPVAVTVAVEPQEKLL